MTRAAERWRAVTENEVIMRRSWAGLIAGVLLLSALVAPAPGAARTRIRAVNPSMASLLSPVDPRSQVGRSSGAHVRGEVVVRYSIGTALAARRRERRVAGARLLETTPVARTEVLKLDARTGVAEAVEELSRRPNVAWAEPNLILSGRATPNDPVFPNEWGLDNRGQQFAQGIPGGTPDADIDAPEAWDITTGSSQVVVAVTDTGVDYNHPDLAANIFSNPGEAGPLSNNGLDDDGNGFVDDFRGFDFVGGDNDPFDQDAQAGHGTHVAGTIGARGDNGISVAGVAWEVSLMPVRVLGSNGSGSEVQIANGFDYAAENGADIVSASLGGAGASNLLASTVQDHPATLFVVAAGNGGDDGIGDNNESAPQTPCNITATNLICVAATDHNDALTDFSNFGATSVDLSAPGFAIFSTAPTSFDAPEDVIGLSGTSQATPHVSGVAALLLAADPQASVADLRAALLGGTDPKPSLSGKTVTGGRLNALRSLQIITDGGGGDVTAPRVTGVSDAPDPFTPRRTRRRRAKIFFTLDETGHVIIDVMRRGVVKRHLVSEDDVTPGSYRARWDGRRDDGRLARAGTYTYAITATDASGNGSVPAKGKTTLRR